MNTLPSAAPQSVIVIGAGVIGLACAHYLREAGLDVTVLERDRVGSGASRGNAGEICPGLVEPLPAPGVITKALRGIHRPDSALHVHPRPTTELVRFLTGFARRANRGDHQRGAQALAGFAQDTFALFEELEQLGADGAARKDGYLFAFPSREDAGRAHASFAALGAPLSADGVLDRAGMATTEPALSDAARAGFVVEDQWSVDPSRFVDGLTARLRDNGVHIVEGARVTSVDEVRGGVRVRTSAGTYGADRAVVAAGVWSQTLLRGLGVDPGLFPGKGYSFSVRSQQPLRRLVHLGTAHVVLTPLDETGERIRVAGTMEFEADADRYREARVRAIVAAARPYLKGADWAGREEEWVGARPLTRDGLPLIGAVPGTSRIVAAGGHNMLGLMLAPATGRAVAGLVTGDRAAAEATRPFALERLARRPRTKREPQRA
ncbi:NAD(P)/FAD-dependent oxidoreductase [Streptomyces sp. NPDC056949]|uniref:NAD(P)/FAD-dependent oxidoreductase n=1 Tax=Streptomyces sp. NPDC056949 TaxID=3345976 RepID=UPI003643A33B